MELFEKVEKLRQHANVSYEEAKEALDACNGDLLDAMIYLEKRGKAKAPGQSMHSTSYDQQAEYTSVEATVINEEKKCSDNFWKRLGRFMKRIWKFSINNYFVISKRGEEIVTLPILVAAIILIFFWWASIIALIILLFFEFRYSFRGTNDLNGANNVMGKAGDMADKVKDDFRNKQ